MAFGHLEALELSVLLLATPFLFLGYVRTRRLQPYLQNAGLQSLGRFFLLYGIASVIRFGFTVVAIAAGQSDAVQLADPVALPGSGPLAFHFFVTHILLLAALGVVGAQYLRGARGLAAGLLAVAAVSLPLLEAILAAIPAVITIANQHGRHTRRSRHIAIGFSLLALGHLMLVPLATVTSYAAFHLIAASQLLALFGALALVFALPRGVP
ncbi:MAG: hypothetical protein WC876_07610 [Candidatus Thermoplasmatota archaeon]|jgi:hypothetical protein